MAITHQTDYYDEGLARLPEQYIGRPKMAGFLLAWLTEVQAVEDAMWAVFADRVLSSGLATGDLLDKLGKIVGQSRMSFNDAQYTLLISARIRANRSNGLREDLIAIASLLVPGAVIVVHELYPCTVYIQPNGVPSVDAYFITAQFLKRAVSAGIALDFVWMPQNLASSLIFSSTYGGVTDGATQVPGSIYVGGIGGGKFSGVVEVTGGP